MKSIQSDSPLEGGQGGVKGVAKCKKTWAIYTLACLFCLISSSVFSQTREQVYVGARPLGLGETFVAIADDGNAVYWNPAGLPSVKRLEFNSMYANLYNIDGLNNSYLSLVLPITPRIFLGGSWFNFELDESELGFSRNKKNLAVGMQILENFSLGANIKFIETDARLDGAPEGSSDGVGFDVGALYTLPVQNNWLQQITFGVMAYDLGGTEVSFNGSDRKEEILPQNIRFGVALRPKDEISLSGLTLKDALLAIDIDDRFHFGAEVWPLSNLALRAGVQKDFQTGESLSFSFGGSIKIPHLPVQLDYAYISPPTLPATHAFSVSLVPSPAPIKIQNIRVDDLFASFFRTYASTPIGYVDIRNGYDKEIEVTVKVSVPGLSLAPTQEKFSLDPNQNNSTAFSIIFSDHILDNRENSNRQVEVTVEYAIDNQPKKISSTQKFLLYGRGKITWEQPAKAAAFVTPLDAGVQTFVDEATSQFPYKSEIELGKLYTAMQLFNALGQIGMRYTDDPNFAAFDKTQHFVDFIRYPAELLVSKSGDCDDLTVLYASLLEYAGIRTAFVSTQDHITLMFDTGIHERNWGLLPFEESLLVVNPDSTHSIWVPVEVTAVGKSFAAAWQEGAERFYRSKADTASGFETVMIGRAGRVYLQALPSDVDLTAIPLPDVQALQQAFIDDSLWVARKNSTVLNSLLVADLQSTTGNDSLRNRLGIILAQQNRFEDARSHFLQVSGQSAFYSRALVNLANIYTIQGQLLQADSIYTLAASYLSSAPGLLLNRSVLFQLLAAIFPESEAEYQDKSMQAFQDALGLLDNDISQAFWLLGLPEEEIITKAGILDDIKDKLKAVKKFLKDAARSVLHKKTKGARLQRAGIKRGVDKDLGFLLWWTE